MGGVLTTPHRKKTYFFANHENLPLTWTDALVRNKQRNRDMRFGTLNACRLYRAGSLTAATIELTRYKLDLVGVQLANCDKRVIIISGDYNYFNVK
jgi:hypothetical protein